VTEYVLNKRYVMAGQDARIAKKQTQAMLETAKEILGTASSGG
jgi:hypothetical protein